MCVVFIPQLLIELDEVLCFTQCLFKYGHRGVWSLSSSVLGWAYSCSFSWAIIWLIIRKLHVAFMILDLNNFFRIIWNLHDKSYEFMKIRSYWKQFLRITWYCKFNCFLAFTAPGNHQLNVTAFFVHVIKQAAQSNIYIFTMVGMSVLCLMVEVASNHLHMITVHCI